MKAPIPDHIAKLMTPADRKREGVLLPEERREKQDERLEKDLQKLCEQELNSRGIAFLHLSFRAREKIGWPDLVFCVRQRGVSRPIAIELKIGNKNPTAEHWCMLAKMRDNGWETYLLYSFDIFLDILENKQERK